MHIYGVQIPRTAKYVVFKSYQRKVKIQWGLLMFAMGIRVAGPGIYSRYGEIWDGADQ